MMNYEQAVQQSVTLKRQGLTYPKIEQHLKDIGYVSARTKKPVTALAVRHMVTQAELRDKKEAAVEAKQSEQAIKFSSPEYNTVVAVKRLLDMEEIASSIKLKLIRALVNDDSIKA